MSEEEKHANAASTKSRMLPWLLVAAVAVCVLAAQTLSFITREMPTTGKLQFGSVDIETVITTVNAAGEEVIAPEGEALVTGEADAYRIVRVRNTGDHPLYVRVKLGFFCVDAQGAAHARDNLVEYAPAAYDPDGRAWVARGEDGAAVSAVEAFAGAPVTDGYLYLTAPLAPGELSEPVIAGLRVATKTIVDEYGGNSTYRLSADAFGVQSENQHTANVLEVEGWPAA